MVLLQLLAVIAGIGLLNVSVLLGLKPMMNRISLSYTSHDLFQFLVNVRAKTQHVGRGSRFCQLMDAKRIQCDSASQEESLLETWEAPAGIILQLKGGLGFTAYGGSAKSGTITLNKGNQRKKIILMPVTGRLKDL